MKDKYFKISKKYERDEEYFSLYNTRKGIDLTEDYNDKSITVDVARKMCDAFVMPKNCSYEKVKKILKSDYDRIFSRIYADIQSFQIEGCECYMKHESRTWIKLHSFTPKKINGTEACSIEFEDNNDYISCTITISESIRNRRSVRNSYTPVDTDTFIKIKALVLEYLYDSDSVELLLDKFTDSFIRLALNDGEPLVPLHPVADLAAISERIAQRRDALTRQLIEFDENREKRSRLRAEIAGLDFALRVLSTAGQ